MRADSPSILQVLPALDTGGVERGTIEIAAAITQAGGRALIASSGGRLLAHARHAGATHFDIPLGRKAPWSIWRNASRLTALIRAEHIDIVHARSRAPAWAAWLACRRTGAHFLTTWHGTYSENLPLKRHYNAVMARGERIIAISQFIATLIERRHPAATPRLTIIPRGVDATTFDPAAVNGDRVQKLAAQWRLPEGLAVILLPGRLTRWKGQTVAIEALALLPRKDICLVLAGPTQGRAAYARELTRLALARGVGDRVRLVGDCADMPAALKLADIALTISTTPEAFGRTTIEAQAMERILIATNHGGAAETVTNGQTGFLIPPNDPAALATCLNAALSLAPPTRQAIGQAARASVLAAYTTAAMQQATLAVYNTLLTDG